MPMVPAPQNGSTRAWLGSHPATDNNAAAMVGRNGASPRFVRHGRLCSASPELSTEMVTLLRSIRTMKVCSWSPIEGGRLT